MLLMNGPEAFVHPVTGVRVGPYDYYEGNAHIENEELPVKKVIKKPPDTKKEKAEKKGE